MDKIELLESEIRKLQRELEKEKNKESIEDAIDTIRKNKSRYVVIGKTVHNDPQDFEEIINELRNDDNYRAIMAPKYYIEALNRLITKIDDIHTDSLNITPINKVSSDITITSKDAVTMNQDDNHKVVHVLDEYMNDILAGNIFSFKTVKTTIPLNAGDIITFIGETINGITEYPDTFVVNDITYSDNDQCFCTVHFAKYQYVSTNYDIMRQKYSYILFNKSQILRENNIFCKYHIFCDRDFLNSSYKNNGGTFYITNKFFPDNTNIFNVGDFFRLEVPSFDRIHETSSCLYTVIEVIEVDKNTILGMDGIQYQINFVRVATNPEL